MRVHPFAQEEKISQVQLATDPRAGTPADHGRLDFCQIAFLVIGETLEELFADDQPQDRVAQELESFVGGQARIRTGSVRQGGAKERRLAEAVLNRLLALLQNL